MSNKKENKESPWERVREICGLVLIFLGVFIAISLLQSPFHLNLLGTSGNIVSDFLILLFGRYVSFFIPAVLILIAIYLIQNYVVGSVWIRILGVIMALVSLCMLLALLPGSFVSATREKIFYAGGIIGNFFVQHQGLRLPYYLGYLGTILLGICLLMISVLLTFDISLKVVAGQGKQLAVVAFSTMSLPIRTLLKNKAKTKTSGTPALQYRKTKKKEPKRPVVLRHTTPETSPATVEERAHKPVALEQPDLFTTYKLPPLSLLDEPPKDHSVSMSDEELERLSDIIEQTLKDYGIVAQVGAVTQGPVVTRFELHPAPGVKINKILTLEKELSMVLRASSVRIQAPIPGKSAIGIEIPNPKVSIVYLKEMLQYPKLRDHRSPLAFVLGQTISGEPYLCDLGVMPHLLIAGATGSGKSVCINSIISGILFRVPPNRVKFMLIDPKRVELSVYEEIPHLIAPVICEAREAAAALSWLVTVMEERYKQLVDVGVRNINSYNKLVLQGKPHPRIPGKSIEYMPPIVVVIDELADMMVIARQAVEENIIRLSQLARAVGIHLVIATQRPSVNVITGIIKANFPCRIAFQVSSKVDSRTILDMNGAEILIGRGDMLFLPGGGHKPIRVQGTFVSDGEVERLVSFIKAQERPTYLIEKFESEKKKHEGISVRKDVEYSPENAKDHTRAEDDFDTEVDELSEEAEDVIDDELYREAVKIILTTGKASTSYLQRRLKIGYVRAGRLMDLMESAGIVGPARGSKSREILVDPAEYLKEFE